MKELDEKICSKGNLQEVCYLKSLQNIRSEALSANDLSKDDIEDLNLEYSNQDSTIEKFIQKIDLQPFSTILFMESNMQILKKALKDNNRLRLHLDATGGILRKVHQGSLLHHVLILPLKSCDTNKSHILLNVGEMITEDQSAFNIKYFLEMFLNKFSLKCRQEKIAYAIVTDKSFANINAIIKSQNDMKLSQYLNVTYEIVTNASSAVDIPVFVFLCSSHLCKNWKNDILKFFGKKEKQKIRFICSLIGNLMCIGDYNDLVNYIQLLIEFLAIKKKDNQFYIISNQLKASISSQNEKLIDIEDSQEDDSPSANTAVNTDQTDDTINPKTIFENSPFYKFFNGFYKSINQSTNQSNTDCDNEYYCPEFIEDLLKKTIAYLPFWSAVLPSLNSDSNEDYVRPNNGMIEGYFSQLKSNIKDEKSIGKFGHIKIGRYVRYIRQKIDVDAKKIRIQLPDKHPHRKSRKCGVETALLCSQENWKNKSNVASSIMFNPESSLKELGLFLYNFINNTII